jgi:urease accessory protein
MARTAFPPIQMDNTPDLSVDRLRLAQLLSPAFPIGAFAHSQGLETAIDQGHVDSAASLQDWIRMVLTHGSGHMDAVFVSLARQNALPMQDLADLYHAMAATAERAQEADELGQGFQSLLAALGTPQPALPYALALGLATRDLALPPAEILGLMLQTLATQLIFVAIRFKPMGQAQGQQVLAALNPCIAELAAKLATATLADLHSFTPGADMASMRHETQTVRIFRT